MNACYALETIIDSYTAWLAVLWVLTVCKCSDAAS